MTMSVDSESSNLSNIIMDLIRYQNKQLLKHISQVKGWDEKELVNKFLYNNPFFENNDNFIEESFKNLELGIKCVKKKYDNFNMNHSHVSDSENDYITSLFIKEESGSHTKNISEEIEKPKRKRGRPKKSDADKSSILQKQVNLEEKPKRKRGRPRKNETKKITQNSHIDLKEEVENNPELNKYDEKISSENDSSLDEESEVEYEEVSCNKIEYEGNQYLIDNCSNNIYSIDNNHYFIGRYNDKKNIIDFDALE